jgi:hypothetical protein
MPSMPPAALAPRPVQKSQNVASKLIVKASVRYRQGINITCYDERQKPTMHGLAL